MQVCQTVDPWVHICTSGELGKMGEDGGNHLCCAEGETEVKFIRNTREIHEIGKNSNRLAGLP